MTDPAPRRESGLRVILVYTLVKAAIWIVLATVLGLLAVGGRIDQFRELAQVLRTHLASRWSLALADGLIAALSTKGLRIIEVGLVLEAALSSLEGYALWRGHRWGPWLVVVASALPLPLEVWELGRAISPLRVSLLLVNVAIIAYLLRWLRRHPRHPAAAR